MQIVEAQVVLAPHLSTDFLSHTQFHLASTPRLMDKVLRCSKRSDETRIGTGCAWILIVTDELGGC